MLSPADPPIPKQSEPRPHSLRPAPEPARWFSPIAESREQRAVCRHIEFGDAVVLRVSSLGDDLVGKRNQLASGRDKRIALKYHAQASRLGRHGRIDRGTEIKQQARLRADSS